MNDTKIRITGIVSAIALLGVILSYANTAQATLSPAIVTKIQKPELYLYLSSPVPVANVVVTATFQGTSLYKVVSLDGISDVLVPFAFSPMDRSIVDRFDACAYNPRTAETNCTEPIVWWNPPGPSSVRLQVLNTRG
jgi:hypothetical protein